MYRSMWYMYVVHVWRAGGDKTGPTQARKTGCQCPCAPCSRGLLVEAFEPVDCQQVFVSIRLALALLPVGCPELWDYAAVPTVADTG